MPEPYTTFSSRAHPAARGERRHRPDHPRALPQDDREVGPRRAPCSTTGATTPTAVPSPDFVLNRPEMQGRQVLLAGDNFGSGSSREHAPWALTAWGIRAIISTRFADIFRNNSLKNGLLPIVVDPDTHRQLFEQVGPTPTCRSRSTSRSRSCTCRATRTSTSRSTRSRARCCWPAPTRSAGCSRAPTPSTPGRRPNPPASTRDLRLPAPSRPSQSASSGLASGSSNGRTQPGAAAYTSGDPEE